MKAKDAVESGKKHKAEIVDFKFIDVPRVWQRFSTPAAEPFEDGVVGASAQCVGG